MFLPPGEKIIETKKCRISGQDFFVTDKDLEFYDKVSPIFGGKKYSIPSPTLCPDERMRRRLAFRNQHKVYMCKSSATGKDIFSECSPDKPYLVYENSAYYSDSWNPVSYGRVFDSSKTFSEQFRGLMYAVPRNARSAVNLENSEYCNNVNDIKDCYLSFAGGDSEKLLYTELFKSCYSCIDCLGISYCKNCYSCISCENCDTSLYCQNCSRCTECILCHGCVGCNHCFSCTNLANAEYCIANKKYTREVYLDMISKIEIDKVIASTRSWIANQPKRGLQGVNIENSTGDDLYNVKNLFYCFECYESENFRYCSNIKVGRNCMDVSNFGWDLEWCYESCSIGHNSQNILFSYDVWRDVSNIMYSQNCRNIHDCFACFSLHSHEHHCILNTPYSIHEYEALCSKIIDHMKSTGEWGEFFPHRLSPFGYNETSAQDYFPMTEEDVAAKGWNWHKEEIKKIEGDPYIALPISQYDERIIGFETAQKNIDAVLAGTMRCEVTKRPFKIVRQELLFYIENSLPLPTKHPDQRHTERMAIKNPRILYERACFECRQNISTTYSTEISEKVLCEECYRKLVY